MKVHLLVIGLFLQVTNAYAQENSRYPVNPEGRWQVVKIQYPIDDTGEKLLEKYTYYIREDTIIGDTRYLKLYKSGVLFYEEPFYFEGIYSGAIRDKENKIYFVRPQHATEELLADYNMTMGDTIRSHIGEGMVINKMDTLNDGRLIFSSVPFICGGCCAYPGLIEGIGHTGGIIEDPPCYHVGHTSYRLVCYSENDNLIFPENQSPDYCNQFSSMPTEIDGTPEIILYPVPASNSITLKFRKIQAKPVIINIYNSLGSLVLTYDKNANSSEESLNIQHLKKGLYVIQVVIDDYLYTRKVVIK